MFNDLKYIKKSVYKGWQIIDGRDDASDNPFGCLFADSDGKYPQFAIVPPHEYKFSSACWNIFHASLMIKAHNGELSDFWIDRYEKQLNWFDKKRNWICE